MASAPGRRGDAGLIRDEETSSVLPNTLARCIAYSRQDLAWCGLAQNSPRTWIGLAEQSTRGGRDEGAGRPFDRKNCFHLVSAGTKCGGKTPRPVGRRGESW